MSAILTSSVRGPMLVPPYDVYLSQAMIRLGEYCPAEFETWRPYLPERGTVLDIGANFGAHTFAFARAVGPKGAVIAVEPQWALFAMLCGSSQLQGARNVRARWCAMGREASTVHIPTMDYTKGGNFGGLALRDVTEGESVACVPLDAWNMDDVDFIKIDVEGMELDVLEGGRETIQRCRPVLSVEADREEQVPALLDWLRAADYRLWWHRPLLGPLWPNIVSVNLLALPVERALAEPTGDVEAVA